VPVDVVALKLLCRRSVSPASFFSILIDCSCFLAVHFRCITLITTMVALACCCNVVVVPYFGYQGRLSPAISQWGLPSRTTVATNSGKRDRHGSAGSSVRSSRGFAVFDLRYLL
jgi:hypothetical protein